MTAVHETAYPRMRSALTDTELQGLYTPTPDDLAFIERATKSTVAAFGGLLLRKTFQRLGYFLAFDEVPPPLAPASGHRYGRAPPPRLPPTI